MALYGESRRSFGRVNVTIPGSFRILMPESHAMTTVNLSESGVMFRTDQKLPVGTVIEFKMQSPASSQPITASGGSSTSTSGRGNSSLPCTSPTRETRIGPLWASSFWGRAGGSSFPRSPSE